MAQHVHWKRFLSDAQDARAAQIARGILGTLRDPAGFDTLVARVRDQSLRPDFTGWQPSTLTYGSSGLALVFAYAARCEYDPSWLVDARRHLAIAAHASEAREVRLGLFAGISGLGLVANYVAQEQNHYAALRGTIDKRIADAVQPRLCELASRTGGVRTEEIDLISGLTGVAWYLLTRLSSPLALETLRSILVTLVALSREESSLPAWYMPAEIRGGVECHGYVDCGVSHGVAGELTVMASALLAGVDVPGLHEAVDRAAAWLSRYRRDDEWGPNWPKRITVQIDTESEVSKIASAAQSDGKPLARTAWCYGPPMIALALQRAGRALEKPALCDLATQTVRAIAGRPSDAHATTSMTFCHGTAGLLLMMLHFANEVDEGLFAPHVRWATDILLDAYDPSLPLGYRNIEPYGARVDHPGLLDGAAGIAAILLAATHEVAPAWDTVFLLS